MGGLVVALDIVNATTLLSGILGAAGIVGLAIGFAVRDTIENFIASIMLSIRQPFRPNDTVEIESRIVNFSRNAERRFTFQLGVASDVDLDQARVLTLGVLEGLTFVLETPQASLYWKHRKRPSG